MNILTRQDLIQRGQWPTVIVQTAEQGPIRLAEPTAQGGLRLRGLMAQGAPEAQRTAALVQVTCVDENGRTVFADDAAAAALLDAISLKTLTELVDEGWKLLRTPEAEPGKPEASPGPVQG